MNTSLVFTFISKDRPGLVETLSAAIADANGSWQESRMTRLAGQFAGIGRVNIAKDKRDVLVSALQALSADGITVSIDNSDSDSGEAAEQLCHLQIVGNDRPGIVREVSRALKERQLNVTELSSNITSAPMTGEPLFEASVTAALPPGCDLDELEDAMEDIAELLSVDIDIERG
ncbi:MULTISPECIES: glycine cleavage system protein R [Spongiibacter]|uniref:glycine cleavage system protein R n=1 Tax=Spongiibacter TaxID=630749 RepID=UPI0003B2E38E|nr:MULTISPECIES: ACT domain-containing protein [Spongiibacter]MBO6754142.1 cellulose-binding protein [Spongiibacter sp.]